MEPALQGPVENGIRAHNLYQCSLETLREGTTLDAGGLPDGITAGQVIARLTPQQQAALEPLIARVPPGMKLAPVVYTRIPSIENRKVWKQFRNTVIRHFYRHMAEQFPDQLKQMGFDQHAISEMAQGHRPVSSSGHGYKVSVDHIIERAGSGEWGYAVAIDPDLHKADGSPVTSRKVNHARNLVMLTQRDHDLKNAINDIQFRDVAANSCRLGVMLVPDHDQIGLSPMNHLQRVRQDRGKLEATPKAEERKRRRKLKKQSTSRKARHATRQRLQAASA